MPRNSVNVSGVAAVPPSDGYSHAASRASERKRHDQARGRDARYPSRMTPERADVELEAREKHEDENGAGRDRRDHTRHVRGEHAAGELGRDQSEYGRSQGDACGELADDRRLAQPMRQPAGQPGEQEHACDNQECAGQNELTRGPSARAKRRQD